MRTGRPRVEEILAPGAWSGEPADRVVLDYDDRFRRRMGLVGQGGLRFLLDLPEPRLLKQGDGLLLETGAVVAVDAKAERLAEITCGSEDDLVRVAWHLGNRHLPAELKGGRLRIREDHVIAGMVRGLGASVRPVLAPFEPEGGAYGHGQAHGHD